VAIDGDHYRFSQFHAMPQCVLLSWAYAPPTRSARCRVADNPRSVPARLYGLRQTRQPAPQASPLRAAGIAATARAARAGVQKRRTSMPNFCSA
jgi:hypothetical protein